MFAKNQTRYAYKHYAFKKSNPPKFVTYFSER